MKRLKRRRYNSGSRTPSFDPKLWEKSINVEITKLAHFFVGEFAKEHNMLFREGLHKIIGIGLATVKGYEITNFNLQKPSSRNS